MNSRGSAVAEAAAALRRARAAAKNSRGNSHLPGSGTYGHPAAKRFMKQMKSLTLRVGGVSELSQLA
jgi:hypothetical protein